MQLTRHSRRAQRWVAAFGLTLSLALPCSAESDLARLFRAWREVKLSGKPVSAAITLLPQSWVHEDNTYTNWVGQNTYFQWVGQNLYFRSGSWLEYRRPMKFGNRNLELRVQGPKVKVRGVDGAGLTFEVRF